MKEILEKQREFFKRGATRTASFRLDALKKLRGSIIDNYDKIVSAFKADYNKNEFDAVATEIAMVVSEIDFLTRRLKRFMRPRRVSTSLASFPAKGMIAAEPFGCVLIVAPWNYPFNLSLTPLTGAIAAGNTVVLKLSGKTPRVSQTIMDILKIFDEAFVAVEPLEKRGMEIFGLKFDYVFYTGSAAFAKNICSLQAEHLTPMSLELGGKCPCIVDKNADLETAAKRIAWGKFLNAGQTCVAPDFVAVHTDVKDEFLSLLVKYTRQFYPADREDELTCIITREKTEQLLDLIKGEKILLGGNANGRALEPTIVADATFDSPIMREEIFGAVLPVTEFTDLDEIAARLISMPKPLALYFFGREKTALDFAERVPSGGMCVNDVVMHITEHRLPFGGVGESGFGSYHGKASFDAFTHYKSILSKGKRELDVKYPPHTRSKLDFLKKYYRLKNKKK